MLPKKGENRQKNATLLTPAENPQHALSRRFQKLKTCASALPSVPTNKNATSLPKILFGIYIVVTG